jgi:hypothetical protein
MWNMAKQLDRSSSNERKACKSNRTEANSWFGSDAGSQPPWLKQRMWSILNLISREDEPQGRAWEVDYICDQQAEHLAMAR